MSEHADAHDAHDAFDAFDAAFDAPALPGDPRPGTRPLHLSALGALRIEIVEAGPECVAMRMPSPTREDASLLLVLGESLASTGAGIAAGPGRRAFGVQLESTHLVGATGDLVVGIAVPLLLAGDRQNWAIEVRDRQGVRCLVGRCSLSVVDDPGA